MSCPVNTCDGLSACCDRDYGGWLIGSKCSSSSCKIGSFLSHCDCVKDYGKNPGALVAIIIASVILLLICCWCRNKKKEEAISSNNV